MLVWEKNPTNNKAIFIYNEKRILLIETDLVDGKWVVNSNTFFYYLLSKSEYDTFEQVEKAFLLHMRTLITQLILGTKTL